MRSLYSVALAAVALALSGCIKDSENVSGKIGDPNMFWYENPSWTRHAMGTTPNLEAGGVVLDMLSDGRPHVVIGEQAGGP